ncbi:uncharacterized protein Z518_03133 [Rhinocladiella mackenziei CBS 650.93]|uniref:Putative ER transporter 6TM N-terminal domain-containing protein n=1 Tax=Rhinocladiella mackenziei CBS 650.93 TaxID=1442369 RepID=A0A0D2G1W2_9EURO|nr:uncharacterized protein Z518_03133 [Rhinocladiella mackenziei CBS 650.93]KIX08477.1 hypothetical protein Z518_03133 [Rhinocladiella mackenziei CBS 650.93]
MLETDTGPAAKEIKAERLRGKLNLDLSTFLMMLKGGIPPAIALAAYQSDSWARQYSTLGYLIAIISFLSLPILPRAKFFQSLFVDLISICLAAAMSLLSIRCAVSARQSTTSASSSTTTGSSGSTPSLQYNAAASVSACTWLFFNLYLANTVRAARPKLFIASIQYIIFIIVASTYAPTFPNMTAGMNFVSRMLKVFLTGYALATGVTLFIIPVSSRMTSYTQMAGIMNLLKTSLSIHTAYLHDITTSQTGSAGLLDGNGKPIPLEKNPQAMQKAEEAATKLKVTIQQASQLFGQLKIEISFAQKEIGWGKLQAEDFSQIWTHLQRIVLPVAGLSTLIDILQSVRHHKAKGENLVGDAEIIDSVRKLEADEWHEVVARSRIPFHRLIPKPETLDQDVEKNGGDSPAPGDPQFTGHLREQIRIFQEHREETMRKWCERKGIEVPTKFWEDPSAQYRFGDSASMDDTVRQKQNH